MADTLTLTIKLSPETREFIRQRVERGEFSSESDYVSESAEAMKEDFEAIERWSGLPPDGAEEKWVREVLVPSCEAMDSKKLQGTTVEQLIQDLELRRLRHKHSA